MGLLEKFEQVEIRADARITEADRIFCQKHQRAYQSALTLFQQLLTLWRDGEEQQQIALRDPEQPDSAWSLYLKSKKSPLLDTLQIRGHIRALHRKFIETVTAYLNAAYHLSIDADMVEDKLMTPPELEDGDDTEAEAELPDLILRYEDIIDLILSWFDGRSLSEQAPYEMIKKCHRAAWRDHDHKQKFEQRKNVVTFPSGACSFGYSCKQFCELWTFRGGIQDVLKGLAHFETGNFDDYPDDLDYLVPDGVELRYDLWEFETCEKLERIKLFKNGRMDIRFTHEGYARQFVAEYLGTVW